MHNRKSIFCYLLATIAASVSGCDDLYWDSSLYDLYGKKDGTLNWCGTYDSDGQIVEKGHVVKLIKLVDNKRYEYTCLESSSDDTCTVMERKICDNDDINKECVQSSLDDHKLSKEEELYKTSFRNHACPTSFTCRSVVETTQNDSTKPPNDGNSDNTQNADNDANQSTNDEKQKSSNIFECIMAKCDNADIDLRSKTSCGGCNIDCSGDDVMCDDGRCIPRYKCRPNEKACKCKRSIEDDSFSCVTPHNGEPIPDDELVCLDSLSDQMCGINTCEDFKGIEICPIGKSCLDSETGAQCFCSAGTFKTDNGTCVGPHSTEHCGISDTQPGVRCIGDGNVCNGTICTCGSPYYQCDTSLNQGELVCVDLTRDEHNCGSCGNDCTTKGTGAKCVNSECICPAGSIKCNDKCIDPNTDSNYCGAKDKCIGESRGKTCGDNQKCSNGSCVCDDNYVNINFNSTSDELPTCIKQTNESGAKYIEYCGLTPDNMKFQNCRKVDEKNATCIANEDFNYICGCINNHFPIYVTDDDGDKILLACVNMNLNNNNSDIVCEYNNKSKEYVNCNLPCDDSGKPEHCNKDYNNDPWSCQNNKCTIGCGANKTKCRKRAIDPTTGKYSESNEFVCIANKLLNINEKYIDKDEFICNCATCASTDENEICITPYVPNDMATNPDATALHSLNHCTKCYDSCSKKGFARCAQTNPDDENSFACLCATDEIYITYKDQQTCIPADYSMLNLECLTTHTDPVCTCAPGYVDFDNNIKNGCELYVANNTEHCGLGGAEHETVNCRAYINDKQTQFTSCSSGICTYYSCNEGFGDCNADLTDGCENELSTNEHCGKCYNKCNLECTFLKDCMNHCTQIDDTNQKACCVTGDINHKHDINQINCCSGYKLYQYKNNYGSPSCVLKTHYGCFKSAPEGLYKNCWTEVTASK